MKLLWQDDRYERESLTVGALRETIAELPADMIVAVHDGEWAEAVPICEIRTLDDPDPDVRAVRDRTLQNGETILELR